MSEAGPSEKKGHLTAGPTVAGVRAAGLGPPHLALSPCSRAPCCTASWPAATNLPPSFHAGASVSLSAHYVMTTVWTKREHTVLPLSPPPSCKYRKFTEKMYVLLPTPISHKEKEIRKRGGQKVRLRSGLPTPSPKSPGLGSPISKRPGGTSGFRGA